MSWSFTRATVSDLFCPCVCIQSLHLDNHFWYFSECHSALLFAFLLYMNASQWGSNFLLPQDFLILNHDSHCHNIFLFSIWTLRSDKALPECVTGVAFRRLLYSNISNDLVELDGIIIMDWLILTGRDGTNHTVCKV